MIFCVEDDNNIRDLLVYTLETTGFHARGLEDSQELWKALAEEEPELILLDIMLPGEDGYFILEKLKKSSGTRDIPIIMVTAKEAEFDKVRALEAGADDYITKPFNILEVKARIKAILRRIEPKKTAKEEAPRFIDSGELHLDCEGHRAYIEGNEIGLTAKEFEVLELLMLNPNKVYSRESLLKLVWGADYPGDVRTVDVHIRRLREKIEVNPSEPKYVHTKWGVGYYFLNA